MKTQNLFTSTEPWDLRIFKRILTSDQELQKTHKNVFNGYFIVQ
jgi:hypothetical protein